MKLSKRMQAQLECRNEMMPISIVGLWMPLVAQLEEENATLKAKLLAIECAGCGKTMLECECDDLENG